MTTSLDLCLALREYLDGGSPVSRGWGFRRNRLIPFICSSYDDCVKKH